MCDRRATDLKNAISNAAKTGAVETLSTWLSGQLGGGADASGLMTSLQGKGSSTMTTSGQSSSWQTVGNNAAGGNNDPSTVYNHGGNNTDQCTWMHQKVTENASGGSIGSGSSTAADDRSAPR